MNEIMRDNSNRAFTAFMSFDDKDSDSVRLAFEVEESFLEKNAGMPIYQPTVENVENFVYQTVLNDTKDLNLTVKPQINLTINETQPEKNYTGAQVENATGQVTLKVKAFEITLPFLIIDGEFVPFDVIQVGKQRVPYNRENLAKVVAGLKKYNDNIENKGLEEFKPYLGIERPVNPTSSVGFLGDVLRIQEQHSNRGGQSGQYWVTASEDTEKILEKLATMNAMREADWQALEKVLLKKAVDKRINTLNKYASEINACDESDAVALEKFASNFPWTQAAALPHGTVIHYPEIIDNALSMKKALIIKVFTPMLDMTVPKGITVVVSEDGRIKVLESGDQFLCVVPKDKTYLNLPSSEFKMLTDNDRFMAFNSNQAIFPMTVSGIETRNVNLTGESIYTGRYSEDNTVNRHQYKSEPRNSIQTKVLSAMPCKRLPMYMHSMYMILMEGSGLTTGNYHEFVDRKAKEIGVSKDLIRSMLSPHAVENFTNKDMNANKAQTVMVGENFKIIPIKGDIEGYLCTAKDIEAFEEQMIDPEFTMSKLAKETDYIEIRTNSVDDVTFDLLISYADQSQKVERLVRRQYKAMPYLDTRQVLKAVGFSLPEITNLMTKVKNSQYVRVSLPADGTPDMLQGSMLQGQTAQAVKKMRTAIFTPQFSDQVSRDVLGKAMEFLPTSPLDRNADTARDLKKKAAQYEALASLLEKEAIATEDLLIKQAAVLVASAAHLDHKVAQSLLGKAEYPGLKKIATELLSHQDLLEKTASDLISRKVEAFVTNEEIVPVAYLMASVESLDHLHKLAFYLAQ